MASSRNTIRVFFVDNAGGGFADYTEVSEGTTIGEFFKRKYPTASPDGYLIRVNRQTVPSGQQLADEDRISIVPKGIKGA